MSVTWHLLYQLSEGPSDKLRTQLLSYITNKWGKDDAEQIRPFVQKMWNSNDFRDLYAGLSDKFKDADGNADPEFEKIMQSAASAVTGDQAQDGGKSAGVVKRKGDGSTSSAKAGPSRMDRIAGLSSGDYVSPDDHAAQQQATAATAASRPDRAGTKMMSVPSKGAVVKPGERPQHDMGLTPSMAPGSAQGHTRPVQPQVSQSGGSSRTVQQQIDKLQGMLDNDPEHPQAAKIQAALDKLSARNPEDMLGGEKGMPTGAGQDLESLRARIEQLKQRQNMLNGVKGGQEGLISQAAKRAVALQKTDPAKSQEFARKASAMRAELSNIPKQMRDAEMQISRISNIGKSGLADAQKKVDALAKSYPNKPELVAKYAKKLGVPPTQDRTTTGDDGKKRVAIWSAEKIAKWHNRGPELAPGTYDLPGSPNLPTDKPDAKLSEPMSKPMMWAPKGLDKAGQEELAQLRRDYSKLKSSGASEEELALAKQPIDKIMAHSHERVQVVMPGKMDGAIWRPSGVSVQKKTTRPDKATGQMVHGVADTDPKQARQAMVWDKQAWDWVLPSQRAAGAGARLAPQPDDGPRRPWAGTSDAGPALPKDANTQKATAAAAADTGAPSIPKTSHGTNKKLVHQAFTGKKSDEDE